MNTFWDWLFIILSIVVIIMALVTWKMTVFAGICGWVCAILQKLININNKNEHN